MLVLSSFSFYIFFNMLRLLHPKSQELTFLVDMILPQLRRVVLPRPGWYLHCFHHLQILAVVLTGLRDIHLLLLVLLIRHPMDMDTEMPHRLPMDMNAILHMAVMTDMGHLHILLPIAVALHPLDVAEVLAHHLLQAWWWNAVVVPVRHSHEEGVDIVIEKLNSRSRKREKMGVVFGET